MPTNKPRIQVILEEDVYKEYLKICDAEDRKISNMTQYIIKKFIDEYKTSHKELESLSSPAESKRAWAGECSP